MFGSYEGWKCDNILADGFTPVLHTDISFEGTVHSAEKITVKYTKNHSIMSAGSDSFSMSYADYSDMVQRALTAKLDLNKDYGTSGIDSSYGVYFVEEDEGT